MRIVIIGNNKIRKINCNSYFFYIYIHIFVSITQTIPRTVLFDNKTGANIIQWPVEEIETLRLGNSSEFNEVLVEPGSMVRLDIGSATQVFISLIKL